MNNIVIIRYGELSLKSPGVRNFFERTLVNNLKAMLEQQAVSYNEVIRDRGRIFVESDDPAAAEVCSNVFGVVSTSFARKVDPNLKSAAEECAAIAGDFIAESESFAIRPRRSGNHSFTSTDLGRSCGDAVYEKLESLGRNPSVNLDGPDKEIFVEMRQNAAYVFTGISKGVGGLPVGTQGKMVVLLSGGIDSPVAAWLLMRRGVKVIPVFCNNEPFSDEATRQKAIKCVKVLNDWSAGNPMKMYEVPNGKNLQAIRDNCSLKNTCILCKRTMYRIAFEVMEKENASGIITGSSLGQVASQTTYNLHAEIYGLGFPIYHPLISFDKTEIIDMARKIGTYDISILNSAGCGAVPERPEVRAIYDAVVKEEAKLDVDGLIDDSLANAKVLYEFE